MRTPSICTITRVTVAVTFATMVLMSCTATDTTTAPDSSAQDTVVRDQLLLETTEPFDANEQASRARFATRIGAATFPPDWLNVTALDARTPNVNGQFDTPVELVERRFVTPSTSTLAPPTGDMFVSSIAVASDAVIARSTWHEGCPVGADELAYVTVSFYGFDAVTHTGELLVHRDHAADIVTVFAALYDAKFPIEEMRIITGEELTATPTGDGNVTTGYVCRSVVFGTAWSEHAFGRAVDINPFHNPYLRDTRVIPELATTYADRSNVRAGMIVDNDVVVDAFAAIGWPWGGNWQSVKDWMHFSSTGR